MRVNFVIYILVGWFGSLLLTLLKIPLGKTLQEQLKVGGSYCAKAPPKKRHDFLVVGCLVHGWGFFLMKTFPDTHICGLCTSSLDYFFSITDGTHL